jgi:hypothetical protein
LGPKRQEEEPFYNVFGGQIGKLVDKAVIP